MSWLALSPLLLAAAPARREADAPRYRQCLTLARTAPAQAAQYAAAWRVDGGGLPARHCAALALVAEGQPAAARAELEAAARDADAATDPLAAELWGQAGNAALLAGDPRAGKAFLTTALARAPAAAAPTRAGWLIDRARAAVASADNAPARADLDAALALDPSDPTAHLLSAALARRAGDLPRARRDIAEARRLAPADADVKAEATRIDTAALATPAARAARDLGTTPRPY